MNKALMPMTDDERETIVEHDKVLLARVLRAMNEPDHFEPEEPINRWNPIAIVVLSYAAALAVVIGWIAAERMF